MLIVVPPTPGVCGGRRRNYGLPVLDEPDRSPSEEVRRSPDTSSVVDHDFVPPPFVGVVRISSRHRSASSRIYLSRPPKRRNYGPKPLATRLHTGEAMETVKSGTQRKLFVRDASGLTPEFSAFDAFVFNVVAFALGLVLAITPTFLGGLYPRADIYWVLTIGMVLALFNAVTYGLFAVAMPRSGGDYIYIGRTLSPMAGFVANWGFTWSQFFGIGVYAVWCVQTALSPALSTFGYATNSPEIVALGTRVTEPVTVWAIGTALLLGVFLISVFGLRILKKFLNALFFVALVGTFVMLYVFLTTSHEQFVASFNNFMAANANLPDAYNAVIRLAAQNGLEPGVQTTFWNSLLALPVGYWAFIGFTFSVYIGGEVREVKRSQPLAIIGALLFGYAIYMITMGRYYDVVGLDFNNAVALLPTLKDNPLPTSPSMSFFAGILTPNVALNLLMSLSTFLWYYLMLFAMAAVCVRNIFAWSFDQIMPAGLTKLSNGSPWVAYLVVMALAELFLTLHAFIGIGFINYIATFSVCFLIAGIAAVVFPFRRRQLFESSAPIVKRRLAGIPLITIAGVGNVVLFLVVLYSSLTNPGVSGVQGWLPGVALVVTYGTGYIVYQIARAVRKSQGIYFNLLSTELPPE